MTHPDRELVQRVVTTLGFFIGQLHAATWVGAFLTANAENPEHKHAVKYGLQMTFGSMALTIRKFQDLWSWHVEGLTAKSGPGREAADWVLQEAENRHLRTTANQLVAHFAEETRAWPLSNEQILALIKSNDWDTEQEALWWGRNVMHRLITLRDELARQHGIEQSPALF
jgi:hypothetical protein